MNGLAIFLLFLWLVSDLLLLCFVAALLRGRRRDQQMANKWAERAELARSEAEAAKAEADKWFGSWITAESTLSRRERQGRRVLGDNVNRG